MTRNKQAHRGLIGGTARFLRDQSGSATVWNLTWLTGFAVMTGLSIDSTNARRVNTMMVATADVAALAGSMELPAPHYNVAYNQGGYVANVETAAVDYAFKNLDTDQHGTFFADDDVYVGNWDTATRTFTWGGGAGKPVNAVQVYMGRNPEHDNRLATSLLRILGIDFWDINTTATAMMALPECMVSPNGFISAGELMVTSNATYYPGTCMHGQGGVKITNNNQWWPDTGVTAGFDTDLEIGPNQEDRNGTSGYKVNSGYNALWPSAMASDTLAVARALLDLQDHLPNAYNPEYVKMRVPEMQDPNLPVIEMTEFTLGDSVPPSDPNQTWLDSGVQVAGLQDGASLAGLITASAAGGNGGGGNGGGNSTMKLENMRQYFDTTSGTTANLDEFRTYYAPCTNKLTINGLVRNVVIVSECKVEFANDAAIENALLVVVGMKGHDSLDTAARARFGAADECAPGGGVRIWTIGDVNTASTTEWYGVQLYIGGTFEAAGKSGAGQGLQAHVAGDIHVSAQLDLGGLIDNVAYVDEEGGGPACVGEVDNDWISTDYHHVLVD